MGAKIPAFILGKQESNYATSIYNITFIIRSLPFSIIARSISITISEVRILDNTSKYISAFAYFSITHMIKNINNSLYNTSQQI